MRERVQQARNRYHRGRVRGSVTESTHLALAEVVVQYYDVLWEHHDDDAVRGEFPELTDIKEALGETTKVPEEAPGDTDNKRLVEKPAALKINTERLIEASKQLDRTAKKLGFGAETVETTPHDKTRRKDLEALLRARGQDQALENLPGNTDSEEK